MKKMSYLSSALLAGMFLFGSLATQAQERTVTFMTTKTVGSEIAFTVNRTSGGVTVDWGDGNAQTYKAATGAEANEISGTVKGRTITVKGDDAWTTLIAPACGIDIIDISAAKGIQTLYLQNNELATINLKGQEALTDLNLANNGLSSIEYTLAAKPENDIKNIETINLSNNNLSGQFVVRVSTLRDIDISNNNFSAVYVSSNLSLDYLNIAHNNVKALSLARNTALTTLVCNDNALTTLTLPTGITTLRQIICDNNSIASALKLDACTSLTDVSVSNNAISTLYMPTSKKAYTLNVANNKLTFGVLPKNTLKPNHLAFTPQAPVDISGYTNVLTKDGVPYVALATWATRRDALLDVGDLRNIAVTTSSTGTLEGAITWYAIEENGDTTELVQGKSEAASNDFFVTSGKYSFFKSHAKAFARIVGNKSYKNDNIAIQTTNIAIGEDVVSAIGRVSTDASGLTVTATAGTLTLSATAPTAAKVVATDGRTVWSGTVSGTTSLSFPAGLYIVNGHKVVL